jgi:hypothetical protein
MSLCVLLLALSESLRFSKPMILPVNGKTEINLKLKFRAEGKEAHA